METVTPTQHAGPFALPPLPYPESDLAPVISARTLAFHHGQHHKAYVAKVNGLVSGTQWEGQTLEQIILATSGRADRVELFNNAAQAWNHAFYWQCMKPRGGGKPPVALGERIEAAFGGYAAFRGQFARAAAKQFGSGWAWLVSDRSTLKIVDTADAGLPMVQGQVALLTIDVWEHAYYLDYQNRRAEYVLAVIDKLLNWEFVETNLARC